MSVSEINDNGMKRTTPWGLIIGIVAVIVITVVVLMLTVFAKGDTGKYNEQMDLGRKYVSELKYEQAILAYEEAIKIDPKNVEAYLALVEIYETNGDFEKAEAVLARAEANVSDDAPTAQKKGDSEPNVKSAKERIAEKKTQVKQTKEKIDAEKKAEAEKNSNDGTENANTGNGDNESDDVADTINKEAGNNVPGDTDSEQEITTTETTEEPETTPEPTESPELTDTTTQISLGDSLIVLEYSDGTKVTLSEESDAINTDGKLAYVYFGSYPQSEVTGKSLTEDIIGAQYDSNGVAIVDGAKYKRISKSDITSYSEDYDWSGKTYAYFRFEVIKWRVLSSSDNQLFLLSEYGLDDQKYHMEGTDITWENSTLRSWLNSDFILTAFSKDENSLIMNSNVVNDDNPEFGTAGGADTLDKVFLLSLEDLNNKKYGLDKNLGDAAASRRCAATPYAKTMGCFVTKSYKTKDGKGSSYWWLRTPGENSDSVMRVHNAGYVETSGQFVDYDAYAVRPALYLDLSFMSATAVEPENTPDSSSELENTHQNGEIVLEFKDGTQTIWTEDSGTINTNGKKLAYVYFGSYPQSEVTGKALTKAIKSAKYNSSGVAIVDGVKYKRISKSDATCYATDGYLYYYDWSGKTYAYFKYEPIKWRVLSTSGSQALLLAEYGLDDQRYHKEYVDITWENCTLRSWLNNDFISSAFTKDEKDLIKSTKVVNDDNPKYGTEGGANTTDKVFLLSLEDVRNAKYGFGSDWYENDVSRRCAATQYAKAMGASTSNDYKTKDGKYSSSWGLRSPGSYGVCAAYVHDGGYVYVYGFDVSDGGNAVRPALYLNLSSIID